MNVKSCRYMGLPYCKIIRMVLAWLSRSCPALYFTQQHWEWDRVAARRPVVIVMFLLMLPQLNHNTPHPLLAQTLGFPGRGYFENLRWQPEAQHTLQDHPTVHHRHGRLCRCWGPGKVWLREGEPAGVLPCQGNQTQNPTLKHHATITTNMQTQPNTQTSRYYHHQHANTTQHSNITLLSPPTCQHNTPTSRYYHHQHANTAQHYQQHQAHHIKASIK